MRALAIIVVMVSGCSQASMPSSTTVDEKFKALEEKIATLEKKSTVSVKDDPEFKSLADKATRLAQKVEAIRRIVESDLSQRDGSSGNSNPSMHASVLRTLEGLFPEEELLRGANH